MELFNNQNLAYEKAVKRVQNLKDFYGSLVAYVIVNAALVIVNLISYPKYLWFLWVMLFWGIGLLRKAFKTFGFNKDWEERKIRELMKKGMN